MDGLGLEGATLAGFSMDDGEAACHMSRHGASHGLFFTGKDRLNQDLLAFVRR